MLWRERPPNTAMSFIWIKGRSEGVVSRNWNAEVCVLCAVVDEYFEFLLSRCCCFFGRGEEDGVVDPAADAGAAEGVICRCGCHGGSVRRRGGLRRMLEMKSGIIVARAMGKIESGVIVLR